MKRHTIAATLTGASVILLAGCEQNTPPEAGISPEQLQASILSELNADQAQARELLTELRKNDPTIQDVYFGVDANGNKVINVARQNRDGSITTWQSDALAEKVPEYADNAGSGGSSFVSGMTGALMGYMLGSMFMNRMGRTQSYGSPAQYDQAKQQGTRTYQSAVTEKKRMSSFGSAASRASQQTRASGAFNSSSSRSNSYGGGA